MRNKNTFIIFAVIINIMILMLPSANVWSQEEAPAGDESATFSTSIPPDALIVLDLSGSMQTSPPNEWDDNNHPLMYGSTSSCVADLSNCACTP